jgi:hypothetical protein
MAVMVDGYPPVNAPADGAGEGPDGVSGPEEDTGLPDAGGLGALERTGPVDADGVGETLGPAAGDAPGNETATLYRFVHPAASMPEIVTVPRPTRAGPLNVAP